MKGPQDVLTSIIIPCFDQLQLTKRCLESVCRNTSTPHELILIDNGSIDSTAAFLASLADQFGPDRIKVISNAKNLGFPAAVNQGLMAACGKHILLLNNDVIVTPGWLDGLLRCAVRNAPDVGLVGPVTNAAPAPQHVIPTYSDVTGLDDFAQTRATLFAGQYLETPRLTGFCLLIRRDAVERIGRLDEGFGLGFFDDDDLCAWARRAGIRMLVGVRSRKVMMPEEVFHRVS